MKKNYTSNSRWGFKALSAAVLALAFTASTSAQEYRKSWDFTTGLSDATQAALVADEANWKDSGEPSASDSNNRNTITTWTNAANFATGTAITANGVEIAELAGITFPDVSGWKKGGDIRIGQQNPAVLEASNLSADKYGYRFRLCRANITFQLPALEAGQKINIVWQSSAPSDKGGGRYLTSEQCDIVEGFDGGSYADLTLYDITYQVKESITEPTPIVFKSTNGVDIYSISIDGGDGGSAEEDKKIAVISPLGEEDDLYFAVQDGFESTFLTEATLEELQEYEAILISNKVTADSPMKDVLRSAVAYQPVVNLSAALVEAWGLGTVTNSESNIITVSEANLDNSLFADLTYDEGFELVADGTLPVVTPGEYLKNDDVLATVGEAPYILVHNAGRNAHILIPFAEDGDTNGETLTGLVANALKVAAKSKKAVTKTAAPTFSAVQGNLETTVTINGAGVIRYALGADATVNAESAIYTEPIKFTEETVIKAYALQDGYLDSDVASYEVAIAAKAEKPVITVAPGEGKSAVISFEAQDGAEIHFSFAGQAESSRTDAATTQVYTEPVTVYEPTTVYAFAVGEGLLASDLEEMSVSIPGVDASNIRLDVVSHMTGGNAWRSPKLDGVAIEGAPIAANVYMGNHKSDGTFGVGSNNSKPWTHYSSEIEKTEMVEQQAKDEDGNPMVDADGNPVMETVEKITYKADPNAYHELTCDEEPDWKLVSEGQCMIFETGLGANSYLFDVNKYPGSKPVGVISATDLVSVSPSNGALSWKGKNSGEPYNGRIESTKAFDAPFDIVLFTRNAASDGKTYTGKVLTSTDGKEWSELQEVSTGEYQRCINRHRISVEGEGKFYVRFEHNGQNIQLHDIYILNNGELSKEYTGLEEVISDEAAEVISVEYFNLNGMRIAEPANGFYIMRATLSNGKTVVNKVVK